MLEEFISSGILNNTYAVVLLVSFLFALVSLVGAEMGELFDFISADVDGDLDFVNVSPFSLAMFGAAFGLTGLITRLGLEMASLPSIIWATVVGLVVGAVAQVFFIYILAPSKSSHVALEDDAVGREAEVIVTIPGNGLGTVAFTNISGRVTLGARSADGKKIGSGSTVVIEQINGRTAVVAPSSAKLKG